MHATGSKMSSGMLLSHDEGNLTSHTDRKSHMMRDLSGTQLQGTDLLCRREESQPAWEDDRPFSFLAMHNLLAHQL